MQGFGNQAKLPLLTRLNGGVRGWLDDPNYLREEEELALQELLEGSQPPRRPGKESKFPELLGREDSVSA